MSLPSTSYLLSVVAPPRSDPDDLSSRTVSLSVVAPMGDMSISTTTATAAVATPSSSSTSARAPEPNSNEEYNGADLTIQSKFVAFEGIFKETVGVWNSRIRELLGNFDAQFPRGEIQDLRKSDKYILAMEKLAQDLKDQKQKGLELKGKIFDAFEDMKKEVLLKSLKDGPNKMDEIWRKYQKCQEKCDDVQAVLSNLDTITRNGEFYARRIRDEKPAKALITNPKMSLLLLDWADSFVLNPNPGNINIELKLEELN